jgi:hypothetical protein
LQREQTKEKRSNSCKLLIGHRHQQQSIINVNEPTQSTAICRWKTLV